uniref:Reticulon 4 receptor n=1 Tax=Salvator merianae TaxID=96440 RepID=A0A8D0BE99_SALMN
HLPPVFTSLNAPRRCCKGMESCPGACVCYSEPKITISCQQQGLGVIPAEIPVQTQRIFLHSNKITLIRSTSFTSCRNMSILWIHSNNISLIEPGAFFGLDKLEELDLSDNLNLRSINPSTFQGLVHLHTLHLDRCGLLELATGAFHDLGKVTTLYLFHNNLTVLTGETMAKAPLLCLCRIDA